jgi:phosphatidylserine/phosphatidylglycerophosphate/cardiolipin synthase-like enzyme
MTGGSANIAFTSMWFHSEMNIAFMDPDLIKGWVARLWCEHLQISVAEAKDLIGKPNEALAFFKAQAKRNLAALKQGLKPEGRVFDREGWNDTNIPAQDLTGIVLPVPLADGGRDCQG